MKKTLLDSITFLQTNNHLIFLKNISRGVERECLRIGPSGIIAQTPHPKSLGESLTYPHITTDFSESMIEFITPVFNNTRQLIKFLTDLHIFTTKNIGDEMLWPMSMPCFKKNQIIPIAEYGNSNIGKFKKLYRVGLHHRYGSNMQTIAGIHYNFSMPEDFWQPYQEFFQSSKPVMDFKSDRYLNLVRNVHKYGWLLLYLFGSSPGICPHFASSPKQTSDMSYSPNKKLLYFPYATSLRMSHLGYHNKASAQLSICHRHLESYIEDLLHAVTTKDPDFEKIGIYQNGNRIQISDSILQIENEYYSSIRPKRKTLAGERPTTALKRRGIEYVELRNVDINPFSPVGIDETQIKFLDLFLTWCLFSHADSCNHETQTYQEHNHQEIVLNGRNPSLTLLKDGKEISLKTWALEIVHELELVARLFDEATNDNYQTSVKKYETFIKNPDETFSAKLLKETLHGSLLDTGLEKSIQYKNYFLNQKLDKATLDFFETARLESINKKEKIESEDFISFEDYLNNFLQIPA